MSTRKKYSPEFIADAVKLAKTHPERPIGDVGRELGVPQTVLNNWVRRAGGRSKPKAESAPLPQAAKMLEAERIRELERELGRVKLELEFAKKAAAFFAKDVK